MRTLWMDSDGVSPVIASILMVTITVVLAAVLYVMVSGLISGPSAGPQIIGLVVETAGGNWSVRIASVPPGKLANSTFVLIRDANFAILMARTPFSNLTQDSWNTYRVLYQDVSPTVRDISASDRLVIDRARYPAGSVLEISDDQRLLANQKLE